MGKSILTDELDRLLPVKLLIRINDLTLPQAAEMLGFKDVSSLRYALFDTNDLDLSSVLDFAKNLGYELEYNIYGGEIKNTDAKLDGTKRLGFIRYAMEQRGYNDTLLAYKIKRKELSVTYIFNKDDMKMSYFYKILAAMDCSVEITLRRRPEKKTRRSPATKGPRKQILNFVYFDETSLDGIDYDITKREFVEKQLKTRRVTKNEK